jgi:gamma-glutamyltranspeptidase/glutathione hydrolase
MADRDEYYGDPNFTKVPLSELLSDEYTVLRRPLIDLSRASLEARPGDPYRMKPLKANGVFRPKVGGTTTCVVSDRWGNVVAATPSANVYGHDGGQAGVTYGNRLVSLNTCPIHPNCIAPGKRPCITLTPTLVLKEGQPVLAVSVAGGDLQDQCTLNLLLDFIDFDIPIKTAMLLPRFVTTHHQDSFNPHPDPSRRFGMAGSLSVNDAVSDEIRADLEERGHRVETTVRRAASPSMLHLNPATGIAFVAGDPEHGRHAGSLAS